VTGALSDNFAARFVALSRDGETQWGTPDDRLVINPSLTWMPGPDTEITVIALYQDDSNGSLGYSPLTKSILAPNESERIDFNFYQGEPGFNGMDTTWAAGTIIFAHNFTSNVTFRSTSRYADMDTDYREIYSDLSDGVSPFTDGAETLMRREFYVNREKSEVINTDNSVLIQFDTGAFDHDVLLGVDYTRFEQNKDEGFSCNGFEGFFGCYAGGSPPPIDIYNPQYGADIDFGYTNFLEYNSTQLGLYAQEQLTYDGWLHVLLGARYDEATSERNGIDELDQDAWSYRGGIIADIGAGFSPYVSYSESFLPVPGGDFFGNPFEPRTARQYEVGTKWEPRSGWLFTVDLFDVEEKNYVSQDPTNIQNFVQGGSVGSEGIEVEAFIRLPGELDFTASYSYTKAEVLTSSQFLAEGDRLADIPEYLASIWTTKTFEFANDWTLRVGGGARHVGDKIDSTQSFKTPAVTLIDGMFSASHRNWLVSVTASNLFDEEYYATCGLSSNPYGYCVAAKDRTVLGTLTWQF
jgi:iron complex outermembrane receptor protein